MWVKEDREQDLVLQKMRMIGFSDLDEKKNPYDNMVIEEEFEKVEISLEKKEEE